MQAQHQSSGDLKANTSHDEGAQSARHLKAIRIVGTALFDYQVSKSIHARIRLECFATMAHQLGDLSENETAFVAQLLARPTSIGAPV
jgi:hypothetical protein